MAVHGKRKDLGAEVRVGRLALVVEVDFQEEGEVLVVEEVLEVGKES